MNQSHYNDYDTYKSSGSYNFRLKPYFNIFRPEKFGRQVLGSLVCFSTFIVGMDESFRNRLPEPIDYADHAGNTSTSMLFASGITYIASQGLSMLGLSSRETVQRASRASAVAAVIGANVLFETKFGVNLIDAQHDTTPDHIDLAYGAACAVLGASLVSVE